MRSKFFRDGYVLIRNFYPDDLISKIYCEINISQEVLVKRLLNSGEDLDDIEILNKSNYAIEKGSLKYLKNADSFFPEIKLLINKQLLDLISELMNDYYLSNIELHQKLPDVSLTPPHQDNFYFGLDISKNFALTAYVALNKQDKNNGVLKVYQATHNKNFMHYGSSVVGFSSGIKSEDLSEYKEVYNELNPGDLIVHHCNIVHFASANKSCGQRSNIALRFFPQNPLYDQNLRELYSRFRKNSVRVDGV
jgi:ectoine hydroxylase-related dioxygenase (phytanoyl-CoA dioxygenase family)